MLRNATTWTNQNPTSLNVWLVLSTVMFFGFAGCNQSNETTSIEREKQDAEADRVASTTATSAGEDLVGQNGFYTVDAFDVDRDPAKDLAATVKLAQTNNKNILLDVGGDW